MCGLTRGFYHIWQLKLGEASEFNPISIPLFLFMVLEIAYRAIVLLQIDKKAGLLRLARPDATLHITLAAAYCVYAFGFILIAWQ